jgi:hypothetical protein
MQAILNVDNIRLKVGQREKLRAIIRRTKNGEMRSLISDLKEFSQEGNLQPSNVICGCRVGGIDDDKENPTSGYNKEEEGENVLLTLL